MFRTVRFCASTAIAALLISNPALAQQASLDADAIAFGTREAVWQMDLSPDGTKAVYVGAGPARSSVVYVANLKTGANAPIFHLSGTPESMDRCDFVSNRQLACRYYATTFVDSYLIVAARTVSMGIDGKDVKDLGQRASSGDVGWRTDNGQIIDWLPGDDNQVLMTRLFLPEGFRDAPSNVQRTKSGIGVVKVDVATLKSTTIEPPRNNVAGYFSDGQGQVRLMAIPQMSAESQFTGHTKYSYRQAGSRDWQDLTPYVDDRDYVPLAVDSHDNAVYVLERKDGRMVLSKATLDANPHLTVVASHPRVDIDDVVRSANGDKVIGYTFVDEVRETRYFDPAYAALAASLSKALPGQPRVDFISTSHDGQRSLLFAAADNDPGRYYLFDRSTKSLAEVLPVRPQLAGRTLAQTKPIHYAAADGTQIPAYLTLPPGKPAKGLPAVVLPHGGPSARDEWGFDWMVQFLAARGYAVIQPEYRGSDGYGKAWLAENGFKSWRTSIGDVADAATYLAKQGIADPNRMAIFGWSYGGYAALQTAATHHGLFKAVAAVAPVTDLARLKDEWMNYSIARIEREFIGSGPHVVDGSPLRHAADIDVPVLLFHGTYDRNVGESQSASMDAALKAAGKQSEYIKFEGLDHQLPDNQARALMLSKVGQLLERTIGH